MKHRYLVALGSNMLHARHGPPEAVLRAAFRALAGLPHVKLKAVSAILRTAPLGPSRRRYANAAVVIKTRLEPAGMLAGLRDVEARFGRRRRGQAWGARVLDLDIILWSGGCHASPGLVIPHISFRGRRFVLHPARSIAGDWRDPVTGLRVRHLCARLTRPAANPN